ncbi:MAG TPA: hypothetical protein VGO07_04585 [Candidatus Saccharimonadales bacterium]|jgi:hypothetical protein|nr:hypothetical protein [Candidatus Saccharimonadales bacterium]
MNSEFREVPNQPALHTVNPDTVYYGLADEITPEDDEPNHTNAEPSADDYDIAGEQNDSDAGGFSVGAAMLSLVKYEVVGGDIAPASEAGDAAGEPDAARFDDEVEQPAPEVDNTKQAKPDYVAKHSAVSEEEHDTQSVSGGHDEPERDPAAEYNARTGDNFKGEDFEPLERPPAAKQPLEPLNDYERAGLRRT